MKEALRLLAALGLTAILLLGVGALLLVRSARGGLPAGPVAIPGLSAPVRVAFDSLGIPLIRAETEADAFRVQGYLHARERLWQMELFRRVAEGRLSEVLGERALESDRFLRTLGLKRAAEAGLAALDPDTRGLLDAYVAGVNAALEGWRGLRPPEFLLLRFRPEPWSPALVVAMEKIMAWDLADYSETLALARARSVLDDDAWEVVRPVWPEGGLTILGDAPPAGGTEDRTRPGEQPDLALPSRLLESASVPPLAAALLEAAGSVRASNSWVLGGSRTRSGKPLVANDMHLALNVPTLWYLVVLEVGDHRVAGMSLPGSPGVVAGRTTGVAWAFTNAYVDDSDLFLERVDPADSTRYLVPGGSEPFRVREEVIRVRGRREPERLVVRETRNGPVLTGVASLPGEELMALRWAGHDPASTARALLTMNRARSVPDLLEGLRDFRNPHQNVVFADTAGAFGYQMAGRVPLRRHGGPPPLVPVPGWTGEHDWVGYLPFDEHPRLLDPERGYVVTANHRQGWDPASGLVSGGSWASPERAERIRQQLLARPLHDVHSTLELQLDVVDLFALRHRGRAVASYRAEGFEAEARLLEGWDGGSGLESREAALFHLWAAPFRARVRERVYRGAPSGFFPWEALERALERGAPLSAWASDAEGEAMEAEARAAAREAMTWLEGRPPPPWGEIHRLILEHPLAAVPVAGRLAGFHRGAHPVGGSVHTVNVAGYAERRPPFTVTHGASQRHVTDLADPDGTGWFILPGGQSGLPRNRHALDQLPPWLDGALHPLATRPGAPHGEVRTLVLTPPGGG